MSRLGRGKNGVGSSLLDSPFFRQSPLVFSRCLSKNGFGLIYDRELEEAFSVGAIE